MHRNHLVEQNITIHIKKKKNQIITYPESYPLSCFTYHILLGNRGARNAPVHIFQNIQYKYSTSHAIKLYAKIAHYYCMRVVILHAGHRRQDGERAYGPAATTTTATTTTFGHVEPVWEAVWRPAILPTLRFSPQSRLCEPARRPAGLCEAVGIHFSQFGRKVPFHPPAARQFLELGWQIGHGLAHGI